MLHTTFYQGNVETWLGDLLHMTRKTIHSVIRSASITIGDPAFKLLEFENMFPAQVCSPRVIRFTAFLIKQKIAIIDKS